MNIFLEGIGAIEQACTLALMLPAIGFVLAAGKHALYATAAFIGGASIIAWSRIADVWPAPPTDWVGNALIGLVALAAILTVRQGSNGWPTTAALGALAGGGVTGWLWRPCVGEHLGSIINRAPSDKVGTLAPITVYVVGACLVVVAITVAPLAFPARRKVRDSKWTIGAGTAFGIIVAITITAGRYDNIVAELLRRSTA